jgi:hypothetical protein
MKEYIIATNLVLWILALVCATNQMSTALKEWEYLGLMSRKNPNKMKISILWVSAEGTVPSQCMYSLLVVKGLRISLKFGTLSSHPARAGFEFLTGDWLSWLRFLGYSSLPPAICYSSTLKLITIASFQILSHSSFTNNINILCYITYELDKT